MIMEDFIELEIEILQLEIDIIEMEIEDLEFEKVEFSSNPIQCNVCSKTFAAKSTLQLHKEIYHGIIESEDEIVQFISNPIQCSICNKQFPAHSTLKLHKEIPHKSSIFHKQTYLRKHNTLHTSEMCVNIVFLNETCNSKSKKKFSQEHLKTHRCERSLNTSCSPKQTIELDFCDVTLDWDDKRFKSHKLILSTGADYWNSTNPRNDNQQNFRFQVF